MKGLTVLPGLELSPSMTQIPALSGKNFTASSRASLQQTITARVSSKCASVPSVGSSQTIPQTLKERPGGLEWGRGQE